MRAPQTPPGPPPTAAPSALRGSPFSLAAARQHGLTPGQLRGPSFRRAHRGVFSAAVDDDDPPDEEHQARAWMLALPADAAMYGLTAAAWYGLPVASSPQFQVIVPPGTVPRRRPGLEPHEGLRSDDVAVHRGLQVTTPERTWLDLSLTLRDAELVVAGDAMVRLGLATPGRLIAAADRERRRRGIVRARRLARLIRGGTDSPPESLLRFLLVDAGLPCPTVNPTINDEHGQWIGRPDLAYEEFKIAIQYEGDIHRTDKRRWRSDIARDEVMRQHGWEVIRVTADDLARPWRLYRRVRAAEERQRSRGTLT